MVALVGDSGWSRAPEWPAEARAGDVGFLIVAVYPSWLTGLSWRPASGWARQREWRLGSVAGGAAQQSVSVFQGAPGTSLHSSSNAWQRLVVFTDTAGVGVSRSGVGAVQARPYGGVFVVGAQATGSDGAGLVMLPGEDPHGFRTRAGWVGSQSGGLLGDLGWDGSRTVAFELLPPAGPGAPVLLAPGDGDEVANTDDLTFEFQHQPVVAGGRPDANRVRFETDEGVLYWSAAAGALVEAEATNLSSVESVTIPASVFTAHTLYGWQVLTREAVDGRWAESWSRTSSFMPVVPPSVSVTGPSDVHDDLSPEVSWTATTPRGGQTAFRVQVAQLGTVVYDSGVQPGAGGEWTVPPQEWVNGGLYQARVQVQQTGGSWSSWATRDFTISWTEPAIPVVDVWPVADGVLVQVAADPGLAVDLERITGEGLWLPVGSFTMPASGVVTVTDVLAPYRKVTAYRARAVNELEGQRLASGWGLSGQVASSARWSYLAAAGDPLRTWVRVYINEDSSRTHQRPVAVAYGLGDTDPRVSYGRLRGQAGTLRLAALDYAGGEALLGLLHAGEPLVLRWPPETGDDPDPEDAGLLVFDVAGELDEARLAQVALQRRYVSVPWVEQTAVVGVGGSLAPVTHPIEEG